jgi:hypothetical protein
MNTCLLAVLFVVILLLPLTEVQASTIYTTRTAYDAAITNPTDINFENLVGTPGYPANYPIGTGYYNNNATGITVNGVNFVGSGSFGYETYVLGPDVSPIYTLNSTYTLIGGRTITDITLPNGVYAFGTDIGLAGSSLGTLQVTYYLRDNTTQSTSLDITQQNQFLGFVGSDIDHITLDSGGLGLNPYTLLDNITLANDSPTPSPEPGTIMLLGSGLAGTIFVRRRVRK